MCKWSLRYGINGIISLTLTYLGAKIDLFRRLCVYLCSRKQRGLHGFLEIMGAVLQNLMYTFSQICTDQ